MPPAENYNIDNFSFYKVIIDIFWHLFLTNLNKNIGMQITIYSYVQCKSKKQIFDNKVPFVILQAIFFKTVTHGIFSFSLMPIYFSIQPTAYVYISQFIYLLWAKEILISNYRINESNADGWVIGEYINNLAIIE